MVPLCSVSSGRWGAVPNIQLSSAFFAVSIEVDGVMLLLISLEFRNIIVIVCLSIYALMQSTSQGSVWLKETRFCCCCLNK